MGTTEPSERTSEAEGYEAPALTDYGTIESWTHGRAQIIDISIII